MVTDQIWEAALCLLGVSPQLIWKLVRFKAKQVVLGGEEGRGEGRRAEPIWARLHVEIAPH